MKVLPIKVTHCTHKVCRIRDSTTLSVSVLNDSDEKKCNFGSAEEMAKYLKVVAETKDSGTSYIDIRLPVPLIEV